MWLRSTGQGTSSLGMEEGGRCGEAFKDAVDVVGRQELKHLCFLLHMFSLATFLDFFWMKLVIRFWSFSYLLLPGSST